MTNHMELLDEIRDSDIFPNTPDHDPCHFSQMQTSRAVLLNSLGHIGMLYVSEHTYHKLPGGKLEGEETPEEALKRELLEEMGCEVQILGEVGKIVEYKNVQRRTQTSFCYLVQQDGERVPPTFTESEVENRYIEVWPKDIDSAIRLVEHDIPDDYSRIFIQARELVFLKAAKLLL